VNTDQATKVLGIVGIAGSLLAVAADVFSGYSTNASGMGTAISLSLDVVSDLLRTKPHWQLVLGHYLAVFGIPVEGVFVVAHTYLALKRAGRTLSRVFLYGGLCLVPIGVAYHATYGFIGEIVQRGDQALLDQVAVYFEPFGLAAAALYLALMLFWTALILSGRTLYPRGMAIASPLGIMLLSQLLLSVVTEGSTGVRTFVTVTGLNLPITLWAITSTVYLWDGDARPPRRDEDSPWGPLRNV
jgi:hypothetical protein